MADNFGLKIGVEEKRSLKTPSVISINPSKCLAEMKLVASEFDKNDKSIQAINRSE